MIFNRRQALGTITAAVSMSWTNPATSTDQPASSERLSMTRVRQLSPKEEISDLQIEQTGTIIENRCIRGKIIVNAPEVQLRQNRFLPGSSIKVLADHAHILDNKFEIDPRLNRIDIALSRARHAKVLGNYFTTTLAPALAVENHIDGIGVYVGLWSARKGRDNMIAFGDHDILVEDNLFENYQRKSAIRIKSLGNLIQNNRVRLNKPTTASLIASRHGSGNRLIGNQMHNASGVQIFENDNSLIGNVITGHGRFMIMAGAGERTVFKTRQQHRATDTLVRHNKGPLIVGHQWQDHSIDPALRTRVEDHQGAIELGYEEDTWISS